MTAFGFLLSILCNLFGSLKPILLSSGKFRSGAPGITHSAHSLPSSARLLGISSPRGRTLSTRPCKLLR
jgi:hypothetical protein